MVPRGKITLQSIYKIKKRKKIDIIYPCTLEMSKDYVKMKLVNARR